MNNEAREAESPSRRQLHVPECATNVKLMGKAIELRCRILILSRLRTLRTEYLLTNSSDSIL